MMNFPLLFIGHKTIHRSMEVGSQRNASSTHTQPTATANKAGLKRSAKVPGPDCRKNQADELSCNATCTGRHEEERASGLHSLQDSTQQSAPSTVVEKENSSQKASSGYATPTKTHNARSNRWRRPTALRRSYRFPKLFSFFIALFLFAISSHCLSSSVILLCSASTQSPAALSSSTPVTSHTTSAQLRASVESMEGQNSGKEYSELSAHLFSFENPHYALPHQFQHTTTMAEYSQHVSNEERPRGIPLLEIGNVAGVSATQKLPKAESKIFIAKPLSTSAPSSSTPFNSQGPSAVVNRVPATGRPTYLVKPVGKRSPERKHDEHFTIHYVSPRISPASLQGLVQRVANNERSQDYSALPVEGDLYTASYAVYPQDVYIRKKMLGEAQRSRGPASARAESLSAVAKLVRVVGEKKALVFFPLDATEDKNTRGMSHPSPTQKAAASLERPSYDADLEIIQSKSYVQSKLVTYHEEKRSLFRSWFSSSRTKDPGSKEKYVAVNLKTTEFTVVDRLSGSALLLFVRVYSPSENSARYLTYDLSLDSISDLSTRTTLSALEKEVAISSVEAQRERLDSFLITALCTGLENLYFRNRDWHKIRKGLVAAAAVAGTTAAVGYTYHYIGNDKSQRLRKPKPSLSSMTEDEGKMPLGSPSTAIVSKVDVDTGATKALPEATVSFAGSPQQAQIIAAAAASSRTNTRIERQQTPEIEAIAESEIGTYDGDEEEFEDAEWSHSTPMRVLDPFLVRLKDSKVDQKMVRLDSGQSEWDEEGTFAGSTLSESDEDDGWFSSDSEQHYKTERQAAMKQAPVEEQKPQTLGRRVAGVLGNAFQMMFTVPEDPDEEDWDHVPHSKRPLRQHPNQNPPQRLTYAQLRYLQQQQLQYRLQAQHLQQQQWQQRQQGHGRGGVYSNRRHHL